MPSRKSVEKITALETEAIKAQKAADLPQQPEGEVEVTGAFGRKVRVKPLAQIKSYYRDPGSLLYQPELLVKDYRPKEYMYAWPDKTDPATQGKIRAGKYIPVKKDELTEKAEIDVITYEGTDDNVYWYNHIFVKVPMDVVYEQYTIPQEISNARIARQVQEFKEQVERESDGAALGELRVNR